VTSSTARDTRSAGAARSRTGAAPILLVANNFPPVRGGSASVYANLARSAGGQVMVLAPQVNYINGLPLQGWREYDRQASFRVLRLPLLRTTMVERPGLLNRALFLLRDLWIRVRLAATLARLVLFDGVRIICLGELVASSWIVRLLRPIRAIRTIIYVHGEEITTQAEDERYGRRALELCDAIIVVSRFTRGAVEALLGPLPPGKIRLIENGVDTRRFAPAPKASALLEFYGLAGCFTYVSVCRLVDKKGIDHAIRAFAEVARHYPDSRYLVVGTGPSEDALQALALAEGIADKVIFAGQVAESELVDHYRLGDVFVMPNRRMPDGDTEGFGLVFLEANACGLAVIAGCDGGSTDAVKEGVNGLVVDGHSVPAIAAAMLRLREDAGLRARIEAAALKAAQRSGWDRKVVDFLDVCLAEPLQSRSA
jgi:phosphatidyl-myo-inositol dimannoside synthase